MMDIRKQPKGWFIVTDGFGETQYVSHELKWCAHYVVLEMTEEFAIDLSLAVMPQDYTDGRGVMSQEQADQEWSYRS